MTKNYTYPNSEALKELANNFTFIVDNNRERFLDFAKLWAQDKPRGLSNLANDLYYAEEWMNRFNRFQEYLSADSTRLRYLFKIDGIEKGKKHWAMQLVQWNGLSPEDAQKKVEETLGQMKGFNVHTLIRRRAAPKKRTPAVRVNVRKMF